MRVAAELAMVDAMSADPVRGDEFAHGLGDPSAVAEGLRVAALAVRPHTEIVTAPHEAAVPSGLTFAEVVQRATRWNRA